MKLKMSVHTKTQFLQKTKRMHYNISMRFWWGFMTKYL